MFRLDPWDEPQNFMHNRFSATNNAQPQDALQVWFAGVHGDIGGGYREEESGLSKFPLQWMIQEAGLHGLAVDTRTVNQLVWGKKRKGSPFTYVQPDFRRARHNSMSTAWRLLEILPKSDKHKEWVARKSALGYYFPNSEPRYIRPGSFVHQSVVDRIASVASYRPENLPEDRVIIQMPPAPDE